MPTTFLKLKGIQERDMGERDELKREKKRERERGLLERVVWERGGRGKNELKVIE